MSHVQLLYCSRLQRQREEDEMIIYLFRHGETDWNKEWRLQGQSDIPLNDRGRALAEETADALCEIRFDRAFCSPLIRAAETAAIIAARNTHPLSPLPDPRLMEIHFGQYEGRTFDKRSKQDPSHPLHRFFCQPECYIPPAGAESLQAAQNRAQSFLQERIVPLEGICENVLIVAHGALNRCILSAIDGSILERFWQISLPNCAASILSLEHGRFHILEQSRIFYETPAGSAP